jgi:hypothetical protein
MMDEVGGGGEERGGSHDKKKFRCCENLGVSWRLGPSHVFQGPVARPQPRSSVPPRSIGIAVWSFQISGAYKYGPSWASESTGQPQESETDLSIGVLKLLAPCTIGLVSTQSYYFRRSYGCPLRTQS